jgi:bifunctional enzyme CysN/CysC
MDLVDYSAERFEQIRQEYAGFVAGLGFSQITAIPLSALNGENMVEPSANTPWYQGPTLLEHLETVEIVEEAGLKPFRMRVQWVNRPNLDFRGFCGTVASGVIRPGDPVVVAASGQTSRVKRIVTLGGDLPAAQVGQAITLTLEDEIDLSRGDTLASPQDQPYHADHFEAKLVWLHENALRPGQSYLLKAGSSTSPARIAELKFKININRLEQEAGVELALNEVGVCSFVLDRPLSFDSYRENRATGSFILIDRLTNATVAAGMIHQPLRRPTVNSWRQLELDSKLRGEALQQTPEVLWLVGPTRDILQEVAAQTEKKLHSLGRHTYLLDRNLEPSRIADLAATLVDAGLIVLVPLALGNAAKRRQIAGNTPGRVIYFDLPGGKTVFEAPHQPSMTIDKATSADQIAELVTSVLFK